MSTTSDLYDEMQELNDRQQDEDGTDPLDDWEEDRLAKLVELFEVITQDTNLIEDSAFKTYAQDYAEDLAGDSAEFLFPYVDWDAFAGSLATDYSTVEFDGTSYYYRAS